MTKGWQTSLVIISGLTLNSYPHLVYVHICILLGFEPRNPHILGKCSTAKLHKLHLERLSINLLSVLFKVLNSVITSTIRMETGDELSSRALPGTLRPLVRSPLGGRREEEDFFCWFAFVFLRQGLVYPSLSSNSLCCLGPQILSLPPECWVTTIYHHARFAGN